jgi:hypothetical protein
MVHLPSRRVSLPHASLARPSYFLPPVFLLHPPWVQSYVSDHLIVLFAFAMFYSHEILTSRKYGVATIWSVDSTPSLPRLTSSRLVATLGQASTLKKVGKKAIQDVNVPKACGMVISPQTPMALRLQSHLLYLSGLPLLAPVTDLLKLRYFACVR